jgi:hypothetical protein
MGANAQTSVPLFVANQVLTASQQNLSAATGVPVFATTVTRDAAFGGSNKVLAEGQLCYLEDSNIVQYYTGAAWATVGPSTASGLTLITAQTIGTTVASVTVSSAFSATYDNYKIFVSGGLASADVHLEMVLGSTSTGYYRAGYNSDFASVSLTGVQASNAASWRVGYGNTNLLNVNMEIFSPNLAKTTTYYARRVDARATGNAQHHDGMLNDSTQYTAFTITPSSGTLTGGTIRVYGYQNS